ncbi:hypothetical protein [Gemmata obscuriglobus]|nr:hypothetical protein [Gemmata obscuriglobus]
MFCRHLGLAFALFGLTACVTPKETSAAPVPRAPAPARWEVFLEWLPEDTETLIVAPTGFKIPSQKVESDKQVSFADLVQHMPSLPLFTLKDGLLGELLAEQTVLCVVEGSRRFTKPEEFGLMPYEGCHIFQFDSEADATLKKSVQECQNKANKTIELAGFKVAVFTEDATWSYFVCRPLPNVLICATNQKYLEETLRRIDKKPATRALPNHLPEWKHVNSKARVWAIRHYQADFAKEDPTSPIAPGGSDAKAVGFTFWLDADSGSTAHIRYLSSAEGALKATKAEWTMPEAKLKARQGAAGVIELTVSATGGDSATMLWLVLMMRLGHCIVT